MALKVKVNTKCEIDFPANSDFFKFQSTCYISSYNGLIEIKDPEIKTNLLKCPFITTVNHSP